MDCEGFEAEVTALLYGELPEEQRQAAEAHASGCESCGQLSRELAQARTVVAVLPPRERPPRELDARIALAARAAVESRDVRLNQPLRGGPLHVAAAAILLFVIAGAAFGLGVWVHHPKKLSPAEPMRGDSEEPTFPPQLTGRPTPRPTELPLVLETPNPNAPLGEDDPTRHDRDAVDRLQRYNESLLKLAEDEVATRKTDHAERAVTMLDALIGNAKDPAARWVVAAHLARGRAFLVLGKIDDARRDARSVRDTFTAHDQDPALKALDDGAADLLAQLGRIR